MTDSQKANGLLQNFHSPVSQPGRLERFSNETLKKKKPRKETVTESKQKLDLYSFTLPGLTDFRLLSREVLKMSERLQCTNARQQTHRVREESLFFACANRTLIFPVGSPNSIQNNQFHEQLGFFSNSMIVFGVFLRHPSHGKGRFKA